MNKLYYKIILTFFISSLAYASQPVGLVANKSLDFKNPDFYWSINKVKDRQKTIAAFDGGWTYFHEQDLIVGSYDNDWLQAYQFSSRDLLWSSKIGSSVSVQSIEVNGKLYVATESGELFCFNSKTGQLKWDKNFSGSIRRDLLHLKNLGILVQTTSGVVYLISEDGKEKWKREIQGLGGLQLNNMSKPLLVGEYLLTSNKSGVVFLLNTQTGEVKEKKKIFGLKSKNLFLSLLSSQKYNDSILLIGVNGEVFLVDQSFEVKWEAKVAGNLTSYSTISDQKVYLGSDESILYELNLSNGALTNLTKLDSPASEIAVNHKQSTLTWFGAQGSIANISTKNGKVKSWYDVQSIITSVFIDPSYGYYFSTQAKNIYGLKFDESK